MGTAAICNMMRKKQGITGHHGQPVACKFQNLTKHSSREEQITNHINAFTCTMLLVLGHPPPPQG